MQQSPQQHHCSASWQSHDWGSVLNCTCWVLSCVLECQQFMLSLFKLHLLQATGSYRGNGPQRLVAWNPERIGNALQAGLQDIHLVTLSVDRPQV